MASSQFDFEYRRARWFPEFSIDLCTSYQDDVHAKVKGMNMAKSMPMWTMLLYCIVVSAETEGRISEAFKWGRQIRYSALSENSYASFTPTTAGSSIADDFLQ